MRYFIGFLVALGLIILLIILLISGGNKPKTGVPTKFLVDYASTDAQVSMTIDGPVNAASLHEQVKITVGRDNVTYQNLNGYDGNVVDTKIFGNTQNSYNVFLHALSHAGFTRGDNNPALKDERGYCPLGDRYIFEVTQDGNTLERYWSSSCGKPGTYLGSTGLTQTLFQEQVPSYDNLTSDVQL